MCTENKSVLLVLVLILQFFVLNHIVCGEDFKNRQFIPYYPSSSIKQDLGASLKQNVLVQNLDIGLLGYAKSESKKILFDYENMFLTRNIFYLGSAIGISAVFANSDYDENIREYYLNEIHLDYLDGPETVAYQLGTWSSVLPFLGGVTVVGKIFDESQVGSMMYLWGERSLRGFILGAPVMGVLQVGTGASRPKELEGQGSKWNPFNDNNGASGHAFVGAIPFLTAASMSENLFLKGAFFLGSFLSGWGRIYIDRHYFSQVFLGWSVAYLSVQSVSETDSKLKNVQFTPVVIPNGYGVGANVNF